VKGNRHAELGKEAGDWRFTMKQGLLAFGWACLAPCLTSTGVCAADSPQLEWIKVSSNNKGFVQARSGKPFVVWGVNYDHDSGGALLEDYWRDDWKTVVEDFKEIKALGANVVRIHLQLGKCMKTAKLPDEANLKQLAKLLKLAERTGLYLDLTGLGCYHKQDVPKWYDKLEEPERWKVQVRFWQAVAKVCKDSPAIFCYDLMNEPVLPGKKNSDEWLAGEFGGKHFVQRIALELKGRSRKEIAKTWIAQLSSAIRKVDPKHMITVGVIPWALTFKGAKPLFHDPEVGKPLDFVCVHFYPRTGQVDAALDALKVYEVGKPLVIEEIFPLKCGLDDLDAFIKKSRTFTDGWISFYWGKTIKEYEKDGDISGALMSQWLRYFQENSLAK